VAKKTERRDLSNLPEFNWTVIKLTKFLFDEVGKSGEAVGYNKHVQEIKQWKKKMLRELEEEK